MSSDLPDLMKTKDVRGIAIDRVGVKGLDFPLIIRKKDSGDLQSVQALVNMYGSLFHDKKGTNMSRFVEALMSFRGTPVSGISLKSFLQMLQKKIEADDVYIDIAFNYFMEKVAPVSKKKSVMSFPCSFIGQMFNDRYVFILAIKVPVSSCCPCSKEISAYGAHNQRGYVSIQVEYDPNEIIWIEDLIRLAESCGSGEIFPLLKREDEKYVTEHMFDNPRFVEDIAREAAIKLQELEFVRWFKIKVENMESIHSHNVEAVIVRGREEDGWKETKQGLKHME